VQARNTDRLVSVEVKITVLVGGIGGARFLLGVQRLLGLGRFGEPQGSSDHQLTAVVNIGDDAWICADAFIGPGVTIGNHAIVAARGVAVSDVAPGTIVGGNPARFIKHRPS
jgi:hypothetical protein